jgi:hypothetical protein
MKNFETILLLAFEQGKVALESCKPNPVAFYSADLSGNQIGPSSVESEGNCGGAYIRGIQYNSEIYKWFNKNANKKGIGANAEFKLDSGVYLKKDVYKGYTLHFPVHTFYNGQSHEKKKAFYDACAEILKENGVSCSVRDYLT